MTRIPSDRLPFLRPLSAQPSTQLDAAVARLFVEGETASFRLVAGDRILAQVTSVPTVPSPPIEEALLKHLPPTMRNLAGRAVAMPVLTDCHRVLVMLCLVGGLNAPALVLVRRMLNQPANTFADWLGVTPETLSRWEQGHRPVNAMARRSIELAFRALVAPASGTAWVLATLPEPPVPISPDSLSISLAEGRRWLERLNQHEPVAVEA